MRRTIIGVMGPGVAGRALRNTAFALGALIARNGWILLTGGRTRGVMDAASRGAKTMGGLTVGILPSAYGASDVSSSVDIAVFTNLGDARNAINVQSSDVIVACGATTPGTLSEISLALKSRKHVVLLEPDKRARAFLKKVGRDFLHPVSEAESAIAAIKKLGMRPDPPWQTETPANRH